MKWDKNIFSASAASEFQANPADRCFQWGRAGRPTKHTLSGAGLPAAAPGRGGGRRAPGRAAAAAAVSAGSGSVSASPRHARYFKGAEETLRGADPLMSLY